MRVAVLGSGRGSNLAALLACIEAGHVDATVGLVVSDRQGSRILETARAAGVAATLEIPRAGMTAPEHQAAIRDALVADAPDLVVLAGFMRILEPATVASFPGRIVNIHPSLLPAFPGAHGVRDTLRGGARLAGCTTHIVTSDLDAGPIILQAAIAVRPGDDERRLADRVLRLEHLLLPRSVQLFAEGRIHVEGDAAGGVAGARVRIDPGSSWLRHGPPPAAGALYSEGY